LGALSVVRTPEVELLSNGSVSGLRQWRVAFVGDRGSGEISSIEFDGSDLVAQTGTSGGRAIVTHTPIELACADCARATIGSSSIEAVAIDLSAVLSIGDFVRVIPSTGNASHIFAVTSVDYNGTDSIVGIDGAYTGATEPDMQMLFGDAAPGALAEAYVADEVSQSSLATLATADGESAFRYAIEGLVTGAEYFVRVSASYNDLGQGAPTLSSPAAASPPIQRPGPPAAAQLMGESASSLRVFFNAPVSDGGSAVQAYRVDWDTNAKFSSGTRGGPLGSTQVDAADLDPSAGAEGRTACMVTACSFTLHQLETGVRYFVRVAASNAYGTSVEATRTSPASRMPSGAPLPPTRSLLLPSTASTGSAD